MGHFFSLKNSKFFSGLKKMPHNAIHYYLPMHKEFNLISVTPWDEYKIIMYREHI